MDRAVLAGVLLARSSELLQRWYAGGRWDGDIFWASDSLKVDGKTGTWANGDAQGDDLISLYAYNHNLDDTTAFEDLWDDFGALGVEPKEKPQERPAPQEKIRAPILGGEALAGRPVAAVVIIDDSEHIAGAQAKTPESVVVSYLGDPTQVDWEPLRGRKYVVVWPEPTRESRERALLLAKTLAPLDLTVRIIDEKNADLAYSVAELAHSFGTAAEFRQYLNKHAQPAAQFDPRLIDEVIEAHLSTFEGMAPGKQMVLADPVVEDLGYSKVRPLSDRRIRDDVWNAYHLEIGPGGLPWPNLDNALMVVSNLPETRDNVWRDEFTHKVMLGDREWNWEDDTRDLLAKMQRDMFMPKLLSPAVAEAVRAYAKTRNRHPIKDYLNSLTEPQGVDEKCLEQFLVKGMGCPDDEYHQTISKNFLIGAVARIMSPGCQLDTTLVLEGSQGTGKTTTLGILGGRWHVELSANIGEKDFLQYLQGNWIIEIPEMNSLEGSVNKAKALISRRDDKFRWTYGKDVQSHPRSSIMVCTTNNNSWNEDDTGARRFWPAETGKIDTDWTRRHRDALFYWALKRYRSGEPFWKVPLEKAAEMVELRRLEDPWEYSIADHCAGMAKYTIADAFILLDLPPTHRDRKAQMRIASIMKRLGWKPGRYRNLAGHQERCYYPPSKM